MRVAHPLQEAQEVRVALYLPMHDISVVYKAITREFLIISNALENMFLWRRLTCGPTSPLTPLGPYMKDKYNVTSITHERQV